MEDYGIRKEYDNLRINELRLKRRIEELESDKKALTEQLRITSVSQRSELLLCGVCDEYRNHLIINDKDTKCLHCGHVAKP